MPQARIAHQPRQASKALNSPIRIKIVASNPACGIETTTGKKENCRNPPAGGTTFVVDVRRHFKICAFSGVNFAGEGKR